MRTAGITACSDGLSEDSREENESLIRFLEGTGCSVAVSSCLYQKNGPYSGSGPERAAELMKLFLNPNVTDIYDISGGDLANEILDYLDFDKIRDSKATFWGYSDLTAVINAIYAQTGKSSLLYSARNLVRGDFQKMQRQRFLRGDALFAPHFTMVQGTSMKGIVVGGNLRCFLKLAGTRYFPDLEDKLLLLEARSGRVPQMAACLSQLRSMGAFEKVRGVLLGTFSQMEKEKCEPSILPLLQAAAGTEIPIAKTTEIGHGGDSKAIRIGEEIQIP